MQLLCKRLLAHICIYSSRLCRVTPTFEYSDYHSVVVESLDTPGEYSKPKEIFESKTKYNTVYL